MYGVFLKLLEENNVTVADVCKATGINQSTLSNWKVRDNLLSMKNAQLIANYFGVSVDYLITGKSTPKDSLGGTTYYFDDDTAQTAQDIMDNPMLRALFKAARDSRPEDLKMATDLLERVKGTDG